MTLFPWPQFSSLKERFYPPPVAPASRYVFDKSSRLIADEQKSAVACPIQTDRTAVLLVLGQSNAANHGGQRFSSNYGAQIVNFFGGQCFIAASPLLGSTGTKGEYWTQMGNLLIKSGEFKNVVIAPLAFSGSEIARWAHGGDINELLVDVVGQLKKQGFHVTDVLWDQGEVDYVKGTSADAYRKSFLSMVDTLRQQNVDARVYVSIASKCLEPSNGGFKSHSPDNAIVRAQEELSNGEDRIERGVNTDALLDELDRYDDCHIGGSGAEKVSHAWADLLLADRKSAFLLPGQSR